MTSLLDIRSVQVPRGKALEAHSHLQKVGRQGLEGFALWVGTREGDVFRVLQTVIPVQQGIRTQTGVCVRIGPEELHRINVWLYENKLLLIAQIHSHPTNAYHSDTDDEFAIATVAGSLSLVIPDFAADPFSLDLCAVYRLTAEGRWCMLSAVETSQLIMIVG
jgi:hypothetical protein